MREIGGLTLVNKMIKLPTEVICRELFYLKVGLEIEKVQNETDAEQLGK
jgi:hypothetical protein